MLLKEIAKFLPHTFKLTGSTAVVTGTCIGLVGTDLNPSQHTHVLKLTGWKSSVLL